MKWETENNFKKIECFSSNYCIFMQIFVSFSFSFLSLSTLSNGSGKGPRNNSIESGLIGNIPWYGAIIYHGVAVTFWDGQSSHKESYSGPCDDQISLISLYSVESYYFRLLCVQFINSEYGWPVLGFLFSTHRL